MRRLFLAALRPFLEVSLDVMSSEMLLPVAFLESFFGRGAYCSLESLDEPLPVLVALFSKLFRSLQRSALPAVYGVFWEMTLGFWRRFPNFVFDASDWPETILCGRVPAVRKAL